VHLEEWKRRAVVAGRRTVFPVDPNDPSAGFFRRPTHRLDALEAGEPVTLPASELTSPNVQIPVHLRPGYCPGIWWRVTPDDVVEQTARRSSIGRGGCDKRTFSSSRFERITPFAASIGSRNPDPRCCGNVRN